MVQVTVRTLIPAAWLITMQAFSPPAMQRLFSAVKSAALMAGDGLGQVESSPREFTSPLTMLAHVGPGEPGEGWVSWHPACPAGSPASPEVEEARWQGPGGLTTLLLHYSDPLPQQGGRDRWQGVHQVAGGEDLSQRLLTADSQLTPRREKS
jgi:hypothetical protein